jgi:hypothetical protein
MRTLDTNVVVRLLIGDDPQQTPIAERAFLAAIASGSAAFPANASPEWQAGRLWWQG